MCAGNSFPTVVPPTNGIYRDGGQFDEQAYGLWCQYYECVGLVIGEWSKVRRIEGISCGGEGSVVALQGDGRAGELRRGAVVSSQALRSTRCTCVCSCDATKHSVDGELSGTVDFSGAGANFEDIESLGASGAASGVSDLQARSGGAMDVVSSGLAWRSGAAPLGMRGPNYERNKVNRERRKLAKAAKVSERTSFFSTCDEAIRKNLAESRAQRLVAENEAATVRARVDLEVQRARDVASEVKRRQVSVRANIERDMVSIEKTHSVLAATGNVPGDMTGFAATVVGSGSISPNSSASMAEFRACQKKLLDTEAKLDQAYESLGLDSLAKQREFFRANDLYTDNTENREMFDEQGLDYVQDPYNEGKIYTF